MLSAPVVCAGWCIEYRLIEYRYVFLLFLPSYIIRSDVNRVSFHKAVVSMKSNNPSKNQRYLLPTIPHFLSQHFFNLLLPFLTYRLKLSQAYRLIKIYFNTKYYRKSAVLKQKARSRSRHMLLLSSKVFIHTLAWGIRHV